MTDNNLASIGKEVEMDIIKKCNELAENGKHQELIDLIESLPREQRTAEIVIILATAYINYAIEFEKPNRESLEKALATLFSADEEQCEDPQWNYLVGCVYYFLNNELKALPYLCFAKEHMPDNVNADEIIEYCQNQVMYSRFERNFKERTKQAWEVFCQKEADLRARLQSCRNGQGDFSLFNNELNGILTIAFDEISFEAGFNGEKCEIILSPGGIKEVLFMLNYFVSNAPGHLKENWSFLVGRASQPDIAVDFGNFHITVEDVQVLVEKVDESKVDIVLYCQKLFEQYQKDDIKIWEILYILIDHAIGELSEMAYIDSLDVSYAPLQGEVIALSQLSSELTKLGLEPITEPKDILESYVAYEFAPDEDPEADWRLDIVSGSTCCPSLVNGYLENSNINMEILYGNGIAAGFLIYPIDSLADGENSDPIFDFREQLVEYLEETCGDENIYITGGATGIYCGYVDFIAWDLENVLHAADSFFKNTQIDFVAYHSFARMAATLGLHRKNSQ